MVLRFDSIPVGKISYLLGSSKVSPDMLYLKKLNKDRKEKDDETSTSNKCDPSHADFKKAFPKRKTKLTGDTCTIFKTKIGKLELKKYGDLIDLIESKKADVAFRIERLGLMDGNILDGHLNNPQGYIDGFIDGNYPMLLEKSYAGKTWAFIKGTDGKIRNGKPEIIKFKSDGTPIDFVIQNGEIKIGEGHSKISGGNNVDYAGEIITDLDGNILEWRNGSGHYKPLADDIEGKAETIKLFKEYIGIDITNLFKVK